MKLWVSCLMQSNVEGTLMQFPLQEVQMVWGTTPCYHANAPRRLECGRTIHTHAYIPLLLSFRGVSHWLCGFSSSLYILISPTIGASCTDHPYDISGHMVVSISN